MPIAKWLGLGIRTICASAAVLTWADLPASAERFPLADMVKGVAMTAAQCAALPQAVRVSAEGRDFCIRYYLSETGGKGKTPLVFFQGDAFGDLNLETREFSAPDPKAYTDTSDLKQWANAISREAKSPGIYLARIGVDGSSGHHHARRTVLELRVMNAALDAIKQRYAFESFNLVGQSGGSTIVGGLTTMRSDIACAVSGSGGLDIPVANASFDPERRYFSPSASISSILRNKPARFFVTDPDDQVVKARYQVDFVNKFRAAGGQIEQYFVTATDGKHHDVVDYAVHAATSCMQGKSDQEISRSVGKMVQRETATVEARGVGGKG